MAQRSAEKTRAVLYARLLTRRPEIEQALHTRVYALADPTEALDPEYADGLRAAVTAALDYGLAVVRLGGERAPPIPVPLLTQVRLAARNGIGLNTVLRRYFAGYTLLNDYLLEEAAKTHLGGGAIQRLIRSQAATFDRLLAAVSEEYVREAKGRPDSSSERRRAERVEGLLAGELLEASTLGYELEAIHLGMTAAGLGAEEAIRDLSASLDCRLLLITRREGSVWAWLGSRQGIDSAALEPCFSSEWRANVALAVGEPSKGLAGWRLTHRQARAALPVALRSTERIVRYADVALLASALQDDLLATSLRELYLAPLAQERDQGGEVARQTLRAYFAAGRNVSSAAAALGLSRQAVTNRLRAIEDRLGRTLDGCTAELEAALSMEDFGVPVPDTARAPEPVFGPT